jgi:DNA-binding protein WhiA
VNSPQTSGYHLEIKAGNEVHADFLIGLMERFDIRAKRIQRRGKWVVYLKSSEKISDFLRAAGAYQCLLEFENERISRDFLNSMQRLNNVDVANEVKSMKASREQLSDIELLEEWDQLRYLDEKVIDVALLRKENPEATLNELAKIYEEKTGISVSKSGLKHRFVKIRERAEKVRKEHCD